MGQYGGTGFTVSGISEPVLGVAWSLDGNYLATANTGVTVWQARGVDNQFNQIVQDTSSYWGIARFAVLYFGIPLGGIALYEFVLTKRFPHFTTPKKRTKKRLVFFTLGVLSLYLIAFFVGGVAASYLLRTLGPFGSTIAGLIAGCWLLETYILPSVTLRFIVPSFKRRPLHKKARSYANQGKMLAKEGKYLE